MAGERAPRRLRDDGGYTLTELLAVIAITAVILPTIVMALILALRTTDDASDRFDEAYDAELLVNYFVPDAQSANVIGSSSLDTPCDSLEQSDDLIRLVGLRFATGYRRVDLTPSDGVAEYVLQRWSAPLVDANSDGVPECGAGRTHIVAEHIKNVTAFSDTQHQVALRIRATSGHEYAVSASQRTGTVDLNHRPLVLSMTVNCHNLECVGTGSWNDPDGTITSVVWDWGDGTPIGPSPEHAYADPGGTFTVTLTVTDDAGADASMTQVVTVESNRPPTAGDDAYSTNEDTTLNVPGPGVLANDADPGGDPLIAELESGPAHGNLTLNPDGSFSYTPGLNYFGPDSFTYHATDIDGAPSGTATVTLTVVPANDPPVAQHDQYDTDEDIELDVPAPGVLGNDVDVEGDPMTAVLVTGTAHGTLTLRPNGSFTYQPAPNYHGSDAFTYRANDGQENSNITTVDLTIHSVNDAPPVAGDNSYTTPEDTARAVAAPGVLGNDTDVDNDPMTAVLLTGPANGDLALNADGSFVYNPDLNWNGTDTFTYQAHDGTAAGNTATVTITVTAVNDAPVAVSESYSMYEDEVLTEAAPGVLGNDADVDSPTLTAVRVALPAHGTLSFSANGAFTYTPAPNYFGPDSFTYYATDGSANSSTITVTITVTNNPINDGPIANSDSYSTAEDTVLNVAAPGVLGNDTDVDNDPLTAISASDPPHGTVTLNANGSFQYTPDLNYFGPDSFTYQAQDPSLATSTATVTINVTPVNDAPIGDPDSFTMAEDGGTLSVPAAGVLSNDTDVETPGSLTVGTPRPVSGPSHDQTFTLNANGSFSYVPDANFTGTDTFTYRVSDGSLTDDVTVTITVTPVNDPPTAVNNSYTATEDTPLTVAAPGVLGNDSDIDGDALTAVNASTPAHGTVTLSPNGSFSYSSSPDYSGPDSFTYQARDPSGATATATVNITVNAANDPPTPHVVLVCYEENCWSDASDWVDPDGITSYQWDWTNNGTWDNTGVTSSHDYNDDGNRTIALLVTDALGNQLEITRSVYVSPSDVDDLRTSIANVGTTTSPASRFAALSWDLGDYGDSNVYVYMCEGVSGSCTDSNEDYRFTTPDDGSYTASWTATPLPSTIMFRISETRTNSRDYSAIVTVVFE